ncbi:MAG: ferredoxin [Hamadaea sp.]|nr:ferredoxin [Hamadaea sp.]NUR51939.1 ferredoxin [Hamadaea sp.]NUT05638.1 ferredoxin [Hamadaea sp.]
MWTVRVERSQCIGSAMCVGVARDRFKLDADDRSVPVTSPIEPDERVRDAAANCPMEAIELRDATTGELIDPYA